MSTPLSPDDLLAIQSRVDTATEGPWFGGNDEDATVDGAWGMVADCGAGALLTHAQHVKDAAFIAHAREDIPQLLAEVTRLRTALDALLPHYLALFEQAGAGTASDHWEAYEVARTALGIPPPGDT